MVKNPKDPNAVLNLGGPGGAGAGLTNPTAAGPRSPFAALLMGGLSGIGEGMMSRNFRNSYNAGQSGFRNLLQAKEIGQGYRDYVNPKNPNRLKADALKRSVMSPDDNLIDEGNRLSGGFTGAQPVG